MIIYLLLLLSLAPSFSHGVNFDPFTDETEITYHGGPILTGQVNLMLIWYGDDNDNVVKNLIRNFIKSLNKKRKSSTKKGLPQVATWWEMVESYQSLVPGAKAGEPPKIKVVSEKQKSTSPKYGKVLTTQIIIPNLIEAVTHGNDKLLPVIVPAKDVTVQGLCAGKCADKGIVENGTAYIVVGNPETECPEACGWPFMESDSGPKGPVLKPPNGHMAADAMVAAFAGALVDTVLSPQNSGFFGGNEFEPIGPATVCRGIFGEGASPGNPGTVLNDPKKGGNYNAVGKEGKKFLIPWLVFKCRASFPTAVARSTETWTASKQHCTPPKSSASENWDFLTTKDLTPKTRGRLNVLEDIPEASYSGFIPVNLVTG